MGEQTARPRWFSENPSKAWGEKFFLAYSPAWMFLMALVMSSFPLHPNSGQ